MKRHQFKLFGKKLAPVPTKLGGVTIAPRRGRSRREEYQHQASLFTWATWAEKRYPELALLHASAAGERRDLLTAVKLKAMGVRPGFTDVELPVARGGYHSLRIEMKAEKGRLSADQQRVRDLLLAEGNRYCVCRTWVDAKYAILAYLEGRLRRGDENDVAEAAAARGPGRDQGP